MATVAYSPGPGLVSSAELGESSGQSACLRPRTMHGILTSRKSRSALSGDLFAPVEPSSNRRLQDLPKIAAGDLLHSTFPRTIGSFAILL